MLAEVFHVVDVEAHHVAQAAGEEHGVGSCVCGFHGVALHEAYLFHAFTQGDGCVDVCLSEWHSGCEGVDCCLEGLEVEVVDHGLLVGEAVAHGHRRAEVAGVVQWVFGSCVEQEYLSVLEGVHESVLMQGLSLHRGYCGECLIAVLAEASTLHFGCYLCFGHAGAHGAVGGEVHVDTHVDSGLDVFYLLGGLVVAHVYDGFDHADRCLRGLFGRQDAQQLPQPHLVLAAVGGQEVHWLMLGQGGFHHRVELGQWACLAYAHQLALLVQGGLISHPHYVVDGEFVAEYDFAVVVDIDYSSQTCPVATEEVVERAVLTEVISIVGIVHGCLAIAQEEQEATTHASLQFVAALNVSFFTKRFHDLMVFGGLRSLAHKVKQKVWNILGFRCFFCSRS